MGDKYAATMNQDAVTASPGDSSGNIFGDGNKRFRVYFFALTCGGTPADNAIQWLVRRSTAVGTEGAGVTPHALDDGAPASLADGAEDHTAEPTYTAGSEVFDQIINQRATYTFIAYPGGELVAPASANNGFGWTAIHGSYTGSAQVSAHFEE